MNNYSDKGELFEENYLNDDVLLGLGTVWTGWQKLLPASPHGAQTQKITSLLSPP
jgi:hypothetical protein